MIKKADDERRKILAVLNDDRYSLSISAIAQHTGLNRHMVARHLDMLELLGKVRKLEKGTAKKYLLVKSIPVFGLIDISSDLILILNSNLIVQYINASACRYFNTSLNDCIGIHVNSLHFPLLSDWDVIKALSSYSFEKSEVIVIQDSHGLWFEITILRFSLLHASNQISLICRNITEKRCSEEELKTTQQKYVHAFHESPDGIIMSNLDTGELLEVNPSYCNLVGYAWPDLVGKTSVELGLFESYEFRKSLVQNIKNSDNNKYRYDLKIHNLSGEIIDVSCSSSIIHMQDRNCMLTVIRDVSEQKRAEEQVRKTEALYRLLADNTMDVIWIMDPVTYSLSYVSPSIEHLLGWTPDQILQMNIQEIMTKKTYLRMILKMPQYIKGHLKGRYPDYCRLRINYLHSNGSKVPTEAVITFIIDEFGTITQLLGVSRDISYRLEIEEKSRQFERHYRLFADSTTDLVWVMDPLSRQLKYMSPSVTAMLGWIPREICEKPFEKFISPDMREEFISNCKMHYQEFLDTNSTRQYTSELRMLTKSGDIVWNEFISHYSRNEEIGVVEVIGTSRNITEKKEVLLKLTEREANYKLIFDNIKDVIWILDLQSDFFTYVSPSISLLYGYQPDEIMGQPSSNINPGIIDTIGINLLKKQISDYQSGDENAGFRQMMSIYNHQDGCILSIETSISLIHASDQKLILAIGILREVQDNRNK